MVEVIVEPDEHGRLRLMIDGKDLTRVLTDGGATIELRDGGANVVLHQAQVHAQLAGAHILTG